MLGTILAIGAGAWVGGLITITIVVVSSRTTNGADRVILFRAVGRRFAVFFGITAVLVVFPALVLASKEPSTLTTSIVLLTFGLLIVTALGILQARRMTSMRTALADGAMNTQTVGRNAIVAATIRALLVVGYVALLILAVLLAGTV